jgi:hypothetical protein
LVPLRLYAERLRDGVVFDSGSSNEQRNPRRKQMSVGTLLLIILILLLIGAVPSWPYSRGWGYYPSGGVGLILLIVIILVLLGRI